MTDLERFQQWVKGREEQFRNQGFREHALIYKRVNNLVETFKEDVGEQKG